MAEAGLSMQDIDGVCTASVSSAMWGLAVPEYLGLNARFIDSTMIGGSSFVAHLLPAMLALVSGQCNATVATCGKCTYDFQCGTGNRTVGFLWLVKVLAPATTL